MASLLAGFTFDAVQYMAVGHSLLLCSRLVELATAIKPATNCGGLWLPGPHVLKTYSDYTNQYIRNLILQLDRASVRVFTA